MKYLTQFLRILFICFIGEVLKHLIPLPIPASIYGLVLLFLALLTGIIKLEKIEETSQFLLDIMPLLFVPAGVGIMSCFSTLRAHLGILCLALFFITIVVMVVTGKCAQFMKNHGKGGAEQ